MSARMLALAVTAALLLATSGCAGEPTSPQPSATVPPASSEAERPMSDALAQRLGTAVNQAITAARVPGAIIGIFGGPAVPMSARSEWPTRPPAHR
jgi:D-alanyl-D-alanine carboxypeptidase